VNNSKTIKSGPGEGNQRRRTGGISYARSDLGRGVVGAQLVYCQCITLSGIRPIIIFGRTTRSVFVARYVRVVIFVEFCTIRIQVKLSYIQSP